MNNFLRFSYFVSMIFVHAVLPGQTNRMLWAYKMKINEAELSICDGQYRQAAQQYQQAFDIKPPFMRDVYNAWVLEALHGNQERAQKYYEMLLDRRISRRYLYFIDSRVEPLHKIPYWKAQFSQLDTARRRSAMSADFWELLREDQAIRRKCGGYHDEVCNESIRAVDSVNLIKYIALCQQYDYPNEYKHGKGAPFSALIWSEIVLHNKAWGRHWADTMLMRKVEEGVLDSRDLNEFFFYEGGQASPFIVDQNLYIPTPTLEEQKKINQARASRYLEDVESYAKKVAFSYQNTHFVFYSPSETPRIDNGDEAGADEAFLQQLASEGKSYRVISKIKTP